MALKRIVSGGQSGVDQIGLRAAKLACLETGGTAPNGFKTENGSCPRLATEYGLVEHWSSSYNPRTECNVIDSDATVLFGDTNSVGSKLTIKFIKTHRKPYLENPTIEELVSFIDSGNIEILNIAGNRASKISKELRLKIGMILLTSFRRLKSK